MFFKLSLSRICKRQEGGKKNVVSLESVLDHNLAGNESLKVET